ncbi:hypothetical protein [Enterococcus sp. DIV0756]|uniref:hypothetical protein n=1 Tax=Enterococcus sp. DIV0756 TaxID=2774636 RepID=UPI003F1ED104
MNKNRIISIGFTVLPVVFTVFFIKVTGIAENYNFILGLFCLAMYVYYSFLIAPNQKRFLNIKEALKKSDISNEELSLLTQVDPEKINLLRVDNDFTEEELNSLAMALEVKEDRSSQMNAKRVVLIVLGLILTVVLVYFLFGEA